MTGRLQELGDHATGGRLPVIRSSGLALMLLGACGVRLSTQRQGDAARGGLAAGKRAATSASFSLTVRLALTGSQGSTALWEVKIRAREPETGGSEDPGTRHPQEVAANSFSPEMTPGEKALLISDKLLAPNSILKNSFW